jgi:hypothetical protein
MRLNYPKSLRASLCRQQIEETLIWGCWVQPSPPPNIISFPEYYGIAGMHMVCHELPESLKPLWMLHSTFNLLGSTEKSEQRFASFNPPPDFLKNRLPTNNSKAKFYADSSEQDTPFFVFCGAPREGGGRGGACQGLSQLMKGRPVVLPTPTSVIFSGSSLDAWTSHSFVREAKSTP